MQSAVTDISANNIFERLMARPDGDEIPPEELVRQGKELARALGAALDSSIVPGASLEFAGHEQKRSDAWLGTLAPNAGLVVISGGKKSEAASVLVSTEFTSTVALASVAFGGDPTSVSGVSDRPLTGFESDFLPLLGQTLAAPMAEIIPPELRDVLGMPAAAFDPTSVLGYPVIVLKYTVRFSEAVGGLAIAVPEAYLRAARDRARGREDRADPLASNLWDTRLRVEACITLPATTLGKLKNLSAGDLIPIPADNFNRGTISTRGKQIFAAQIGHLDDAFSFRVLHPVRKETGFLHRVAESLSRGQEPKI